VHFTFSSYSTRSTIFILLVLVLVGIGTRRGTKYLCTYQCTTLVLINKLKFGITIFYNRRHFVTDWSIAQRSCFCWVRSKVTKKESFVLTILILMYRPSSPESSDALVHFQNFLTQNFPPANAKELEKQCRNFFDTQLKVSCQQPMLLINISQGICVLQDEMVPIDELSNTVQNFYQTMKDRIVKLNPLPEAPVLSQFMTELETFICVCGYHLLFGSRFVQFWDSVNNYIPNNSPEERRRKRKI
jgi:hypothetical protein